MLSLSPLAPSSTTCHPLASSQGREKQLQRGRKYRGRLCHSETAKQRTASREERQVVAGAGRLYSCTCVHLSLRLRGEGPREKERSQCKQERLSEMHFRPSTRPRRVLHNVKTPRHCLIHPRQSTLDFAFPLTCACLGKLEANSSQTHLCHCACVRERERECNIECTKTETTKGEGVKEYERVKP